MSFYKISALLLFFMLSVALPASASTLRPAPAPERKDISSIADVIAPKLQELITGDSDSEIELEETFGTRALSFVLDSFKVLSKEGAQFIDNFAALPQLSKWYKKQRQNPKKVEQWLDMGRLLLIVLASAYFIRWLAILLFYPLRSRLRKKKFKSAVRRFTAAFLRLGVTFIPIFLFIAVALLTIEQSQPDKWSSFMIMTVIYALALFQTLLITFRFFLAPRSKSLRILPISTENAAFIKFWASWYGGVLLFGTFLAELAKNARVPQAAISGFGSLVALVIIVMTIIVITKKKMLVASFIRGDALPSNKGHSSVWQSMRSWIARVWHVLAIAYLVIGYFVTMMGPQGSFLIMQQGTVGTLLVLVVVRLLLYLASKVAYKKQTDPTSVGIYRPVLRFFIKVLVWSLGLTCVAAAWGVDVGILFASSWGQRIVGSAFSIASTILVLIAIYEVLHFIIERKLNLRDSEGNIIEPDPRSRTLLPMARNVAIFVLGLIGVLVTLSEFGINTGPLLAGAGVLGVALGFGSQTLVKDFLTGLFILIENTIAVGDVVKLGNHAGVVEGMTLRTVKLRDIQGYLHILPFSSISEIVNMTKDFAYAVLEVEVAYDSDLEKVIDVVKRVGDEMYKDPTLKGSILEPMDVLGVDQLGASSIAIKSRLKVTAGKQWGIRRGFLLRIKSAFDAAGIEIPYQHIVYVNKTEAPATPEKS
ncbi:MAG TPA: hypothetical protein DD400_02850 [Rhodospirillaceae bacterium]|nr:hypothetical protein [Rhodospirillaceae bacterium]